MARLSRAKPVLKWTGIVLGVLLVVFGLVLAFMDWNALRGPVERTMSARLGRTVAIEGALDMKFHGGTPRITVNDLVVRHPKWIGEGIMAHIERVTLDVRLLPLLVGRLVLPFVHIERPEFYLVRNVQGNGNWELKQGKGARSGDAPDLPVVHRFELDGGRLTYDDKKRNLQFEGVIQANERTFAKDPRPFRLVALGSMNRGPFQLVVRGGPLVNVRRDRPYAYEAEVTAGKTHATARGSIRRPFDLTAYDAEVMLSGDDLADLYDLTDLALPNTPPYELSGFITRKGTKVFFENAEGKVGDSDMTGDITVDLAGERPFLTAKLSSRSLDLDDLGASVGGPPSVKDGETASKEDKSQAREMKAAGKLFPDAELQVDRVRAMDALLDFSADKVNARKLPLKEFAMMLNLRDGVLKADPLSFTTPQGKITGTVQVDATGKVPVTDIDLRLTGLQLSNFKPKNAPEAPVDGVLRGRIKLHGSGGSVARFVSTSDGTVTFVMPRGEVREAFAELTGINVSRGLGLLLRRDDDKAPIRCGVADFTAKDGVLHAKNLVFDTKDVLITGKGSVNLDQEVYDLNIQGHPKKFRLLRLRSPIAIKGALRKPDFGLDSGNSIGQTGIAAALAAVAAPLAAVIAFVDPGLAEDADCSGLLAEAKRAGAPVKTADVKRADDKG
jgi:uncharacterized protein involved in outer membrane biogenesis